ncbi:hypothetical protein [Azohydromonas aeria]|uniref:hypothetical protein n=1 Tax=Azohydromonas aeria TaxID=2590212 RepID=UPI0012F79789|nr:hypothetical protein [Azohydromonas aeria]
MSTPITVLVSVRIDPVSGRATRSRTDAAGVALAQKALGDGAEPWLCTVGDMPDAVARDYLAQGVSRLTRLLAGDGSLDAAVVALADACRDSTLVIAGAKGESGLASGMLPYALAQRLQRPLISDVIDLVPEGGGAWRVVQALPRGARRSWRLAPGTGAVLVSSARLAQREDLPQRHAWVAAQAGRVQDKAVRAAAAPAAGAIEWRFEPARKQRRPLAPVSTESGAARMAKATGSAAPAQKAGTVIREGSAQDKAQALLDHLRKLALVQGPQ